MIFTGAGRRKTASSPNSHNPVNDATRLSLVSLRPTSVRTVLKALGLAVDVSSLESGYDETAFDMFSQDFQMIKIQVRILKIPGYV